MKYSVTTTNNASPNSKPKMKRRRWLYGNICLLILGLILVTFGLTLLMYFTPIYDFIVNNALVLNPQSKAFKEWRRNNPPLNVDYYLFNWTNPEEMHDPNAKIKLQEVGPYKFKEVKEKINVTWNDNDTISYRQVQYFYYDEENSPNKATDLITILNPVPLTAAYKARSWGLFTKSTLSFTLNSLTKPYVTSTVRNILMDGYEDDFLSAAGIVAEVADKFGFFYKRNGSIEADGLYCMSIKNDENFGRLLTWNYNDRNSYYEDHCGMIEGSAGEFYPINQKRDKIELYSAQLCKKATLYYDSDVVIKGVRGYKYVAKNLFDNGTLFPENSCFCGGECIPSGVLNVSSCRMNSPSFLSLPHFYDADPYYLSKVEGVHPQKEKHEFYIILEPKSGIVMELSARMQLNMLLQPIDYISMYSNVPKVFVPLFYFDQQVHLKDELAVSLKLIQDLPEYANIGGLVMTSLGSILILFAVLSFTCCKNVKDKKNEYKIPQNTHEEVPLQITRELKS